MRKKLSADQETLIEETLRGTVSLNSTLAGKCRRTVTQLILQHYPYAGDRIIRMAVASYLCGWVDAKNTPPVNDPPKVIESMELR